MIDRINIDSEIVTNFFSNYFHCLLIEIFLHPSQNYPPPSNIQIQAGANTMNSTYMNSLKSRYKSLEREKGNGKRGILLSPLPIQLSGSRYEWKLALYLF
ncbi:hypothetical protein Ple7327_2869 [Pleurocapsa sp. PCC 7327]|nr:hypothetical protein Ple7327_2869 [Pleurocapsa sp. PCC 7327]